MGRAENNNNIKNNDNKKRIMLVDNEPDPISILGIGLEENGFEVDASEDPIVALQSYRAGVYDLLILDIKMPKIDGFEIYDEIKKIDKCVTRIQEKRSIVHQTRTYLFKNPLQMKTHKILFCL